MFNKLALLFGACVFLSCTSPTKPEARENDLIAFEVAKVFPHDVTAFTQGLVIANGKLLESTGQSGSWVSEVDIASGRQTKKVVLAPEYFGEGLTVLNNKAYQLTWKHQVGFIYQLPGYSKVGEFKYSYEGWGITTDGKSLIISDGTDRIHFIDSASLTEFRTITVKRLDQPMSNLNELEFIEGFIYANQWQTGNILKIDPANGNVVGFLDCTSLVDEIQKFNGNPDVLNGIAYDKKSGLMLVTGKYWPVLFAIRMKVGARQGDGAG